MLEQKNTEVLSGAMKTIKKNMGTNEIERNTLIKNLENYDWPVIQRYILYGYFMAGPILHTW